MVIADKVISRRLRRRRPCQGDHYWLFPQRSQPGERDKVQPNLLNPKAPASNAL